PTTPRTNDDPARRRSRNSCLPCTPLRKLLAPSHALSLAGAGRWDGDCQHFYSQSTRRWSTPHGSEMGTEHLEGPTGALRPGAELSGCVRRPPVGSGGGRAALQRGAGPTDLRVAERASPGGVGGGRLPGSVVRSRAADT